MDQQENTTVVPQQQIATIPTFTLAPRTMQEAIEFAKVMADSDMVPKDYRGKSGNVLVAVQMGAEIGLGPMAAIQNIAVINGKPGLYGDAGKALLLNAGCIIEEDDIAVIKKTKAGRCRITRPGRPPVERTFSEENAQKAGLWKKEGPWEKYPERQLAWRAFWFAARDAASDILKGLGGAEELRDITPREIDITPMAAPVVEQPKAKSESSAPTGVTESSTATQAAGAGDNKEVKDAKPITKGQLGVLKAKLENAALSSADFEKKFGVKLEEGSLVEINQVLAWVQNPQD